MQALPPMPRTSWRQPAPIAAAISSPVPRLLGGQRRRHAARQQGQPGGLGQLDDGGVAPPGVGRLHRLAGGSADGDRHRLEAGGDGRGEGALAAVGDRQRDDVQVGARPQQARADGRGDLGGRQRALERVGGDRARTAWALRCGWGRCPEPVPEPAGSGQGVSSTRAAARVPGQLETATILKSAPVGSATLAIRPCGVSTAGSSTVPPSRSTRASEASASSTPK